MSVQHTGWVHNTADDKARCRATGQVQAWTIFHAQVLHQAALREEVGRQLNGTTETSSYHCRANSTV